MSLNLFQNRTLSTQVFQRTWSFFISPFWTWAQLVLSFKTTSPLSKKIIIRNFKTVVFLFAQASQISALDRTIVRECGWVNIHELRPYSRCSSWNNDLIFYYKEAFSYRLPYFILTSTQAGDVIIIFHFKKKLSLREIDQCPWQHCQEAIVRRLESK